MQPVVAQQVPADAVFAAMEIARQSRDLNQLVGQGTIRFQASPHQPGSLERIAADGTRTTGRFSNGCFIPGTGVPE